MDAHQFLSEEERFLLGEMSSPFSPASWKPSAADSELQDGERGGGPGYGLGTEPGNAFLHGFFPAPSCNKIPSGIRASERHVRVEGPSQGTSSDAAGAGLLSGCRQRGGTLLLLIQPGERGHAGRLRPQPQPEPSSSQTRSRRSPRVGKLLHVRSTTGRCSLAILGTLIHAAQGQLH